MAEEGMSDDARRRMAQWQGAILDALPAHIALLDHDGTILSVNASWKRFGSANGFRGEDFGVGCNYVEVAERARGDCAEEAAHAARGLRAVLAGGAGQFEMEYPCHSPEERRWFRLTVTPLRADGAAGAVAMHVNVSERKRAEEALRRSEERFRAMIEYGSDIISLHDADGTMLYQSPSVRRILGYEPEELVGKNVLDYIHPEERRRTAEEIDEVRGGAGTHEPFETMFRHRDGSWRWFECTGANLLDNPAVGKILFNARDITERKQAEEKLRQTEDHLRQSQKLESVGRLAGGVAHDFNNMLTAINGYSDLILRKLGEDDSLRPKVEEIKKAGTRAAALTHQLLAFSRKQILQPKVLNLNEIIADTGRMLQRLIGEDVELLNALSPELGRVEADPGQITQVLMNLAVNARDAMPEGGKLMIETENVHLDEAYARRHVAVAPGRYVMLAVSDTGTGMEAETRKHIFEPFFTTKEAGKGTGMGLATVYGIVKQSKGNIWVYSEPGHGTTFKIYLPRVDEQAEAEPSAEAGLDLPRGTERILLVEDEDVVRALIRQILEMCGYAVSEAPNGAEAARMCEEEGCEADLLITDVVMPQMGGRELVGRLARSRPAMRALYISGYTDGAIVHHGVLEEGANFIQKPFTPEALARKVRSVLDS